MLRMDRQERRARLARRHHLAPRHRADTPTEVARSLVALHSTDPASVYLACMARTVSGDPAGVEQALYDERSLLRMLGMRRTVFVVPVELAPVVNAACTRAIAARERRRLLQRLGQGGIVGPSDGATWLSRVEEATMVALRDRGEALGQELSAVVPDLRTQMSFGDETKWAGVTAITTMVLSLLAADGQIVRGRPRGSWTSSQYRWVPRSAWLAGGAPEPPPEPPAEVARVELARRWLAAFGPATAADLRWWTGWTAGDTNGTLAQLRLVEVDLEGQPGIVLADDTALVTESASDGPLEPWAALLPALDPTVMGWTERGWFLGDERHRALLFDRSGNVGPTAWWDGQVVGGWGQRRDGEIARRLFLDIGAEGAAALDAAAERLRQAIGLVRITPRFRTPLERELNA